MAIVFDTSATVTLSGTWNHTCTGSNLILFAVLQSTTDNITTATYNTVASDGSFNLNISGGNTIKTFYWLNPASGTHSIAISGGGTVNGISVSYANCNISAIDSSNTGLSATSPITVSTTVVANNSWLVWFCGSVATVDGSVTSNPGINRNAVGLLGFELDVGDSNGTVASGSRSEIITIPNSSQTQYGAIVISIAPFGAVTAVSSLGLLRTG